MNHRQLVLITALLFLCFSTTRARFLAPGGTQPLNHTDEKDLTRSLRKRPKLPKPCKKCGGGGDDEDDFDGEDSDGGANEEEEEGECFPSDSVVTLHTNERIRMDRLNVGHSVRNFNGKNSPVFAFSHRHHRVKAKFLRFTTRNGNLTVTRGHYIYVKKMSSDLSPDYQLVLAKDVRTGDLLLSDHASSESKIESIELIDGVGLYNPHTLSGELIVDGFRVSTFTRAVDPVVASSFLTPFRAVFQIFKVDGISSTFTYGCPKHLQFICNNLQLLSSSRS